MKKSLRNFFAAALVAGSLLFMPSADAEIKTCEGTDEYVMSEFETIDIAKQRARQKAERNACEQAGVYLSSYSEMNGLELVTDEVISIACGIMSIIDVKYDVVPLADANGFVIRATVKADIETDDVKKYLDMGVSKQKNIVAQDKQLQQTIDEQNKHIESLKSQIRRLTANGKLSGKRERDKISQEIAAEEKIFLSNRKLEECRKLYYDGDYKGVVKLCDEAIALNADNATAFAVRGTIYKELGNFDKALSDLNRAIELNPNYSDAYNDRGTVYQEQKNYAQALADYDKAVALDPNDPISYVNRGMMQIIAGNFTAAVADANKAIELKENFAAAYALRGGAYLELGGVEVEKILADLNRAIELAPNMAFAYHCRALLWQAIGDTLKAQADFDKVKSLT